MKSSLRRSMSSLRMTFCRLVLLEVSSGTCLGEIKMFN
jgi:hypothetical protein